MNDAPAFWRMRLRLSPSGNDGDVAAFAENAGEPLTTESFCVWILRLDFAFGFRVWISRLAALVEPVMLLVVGGIVGFVYISFFMALFAAAG